MKKITPFIFITILALGLLILPTDVKGQAASSTPTTSSSTPVVDVPLTGVPAPIVECPKGQYCLLEPLPNIPGAGQPASCVTKDGTAIWCVEFSTFIAYAFKFMIALAVFLATVSIIYGGFEYMLSEVPFVKTEGKSRITKALYGLGAALISYLILQTIDPRLVQINTTLQPICNEDIRKDPSLSQDRRDLCKTDSLSNIFKNYQDQLKYMTQRQKEEIQNLKADVREKDAEIKALAAKEAGGTITENEKKELETKKQERNKAISAQVSTSLELYASQRFATALDILQIDFLTPERGGALSLPESSMKAAEETLNQIDKPNGTFNTYILTLSQQNDYAGVAKAEELRKFYKEQLKAEVEFINGFYKVDRTKDAYHLESWAEKLNNPAKDEFTEKYAYKPELKKLYEPLRDMRKEKLNAYIKKFK